MSTKTKQEETWEERKERQDKSFKEHSIPEFHKFMKQHDVIYFAVSFNGGGDSGDFEDVYFVTQDEIPDRNTVKKEAGLDNIEAIDWANPTYKKQINKMHALDDYYRDPMRLGHKYIWYKPHESEEHRSTTLSDYITEFIGDYMNYKSIDWYNNEGGSGEVVYEDGVLTIECETYYRESECHTFEEIDNG